METTLRERGLEKEFVFKTARSGGPGGQNVNKVSTKVELHFNIRNSKILLPEEICRLLQYYSGRISQDGAIRIVCSAERSQLKNKKTAIEKLYLLLEKGLFVVPERIPTAPDESVKEKNKRDKIINSEKKRLRKFPGI